MAVDQVQGDQVIVHWFSEYDGELRSGSFRIADLSAPITVPPPDPNLQKDEAAVDRFFRNHCRSGTGSVINGKFVCEN
jgi:hypothetical protein